MATKKAKQVEVKHDQATLEAMPSKSAKIRYLDKCGYSRSQIANMLYYEDGRPLRYQHVRNVLETRLKGE